VKYDSKLRNIKELFLKLKGVLRLPKGSLSLTGFTFVELSIAAVMMAVIAIVLYMMLSNGIRVWQLVNQDSPRIDMNLFFERIDEELKNSFQYSEIEFAGSKKSISFATLVKVQDSPQGFNCLIANVNYAYDPEPGQLARQQLDYTQLYALQKSRPRVLMEKVESLSFKYYFYDEAKKSFFWLEQWPPSEVSDLDVGLPLAVRIEISFKEADAIQSCVQTFKIPSGGKVKSGFGLNILN